MKRVLATAAAVAVLVLSLAQAVPAQRRPSRQDAELRALRDEIESLKEGQQALMGELQEIKKLLTEMAQDSGQARHQYVSVDDDPSLGENTAGVVLIDFSDYQ